MIKKDIGYIHKNNKILKILTIETDFNHNNYINKHSEIVFSEFPSQINFDFLIIAMTNYNTFWIIPVDDLKNRFICKNKSKPKDEWLCKFTANWKHKFNKKSKDYKYINAWNLIDNVCK